MYWLVHELGSQNNLGSQSRVFSWTDRCVWAKDDKINTYQAKTYKSVFIPRGGTPIYGLYMYVPRNRVWFLRFSVLKWGIFFDPFVSVSLVWSLDRVA